MTFKDFRTVENTRGLLTVSAEYMVIAGTMAVALSHPDPYLYPIFVLFIGTRQFALAETMTHEAVHRNLCRVRWLNDLLGTLTTWPFLYILSGYRRYHLEHHAIDVGDPENNIYEQYEAWGLPHSEEPITRQRALWLFVLRPILGVMALYHIRTLLSNLYWDRDLVENYLMLGSWIILVPLMASLGWADELLLYWIVPQLLVIGTLDFWSEAIDHYRVENAKTRSQLGWTWNRLIAHNIGLHALHHRYPGIPWHRLPAAHLALSGELGEESCGGFMQALKQIIEFGPHSSAPLDQ